MSTYLWQNFLKDIQIIRTIANSIEHLYDKTWAKALIEIGPWKGAITKKIYKTSPSFYVIEKDTTLKDHLNTIWLEENHIIFWDVLEQDISTILSQSHILEEEAIVVWNLPYYITSPIFKHLFWKETPKFLGWFFMIQNEVWEKIKSDANKKSYLRWLVNRCYTIEYVKMVPAKCFSPAPKVKSCLVRFIKKDSPENVEQKKLENFLNLYSPYSRKTLWRIEKMLEKKGNNEYNIPDDLKWKRLEELNRNNINIILS